MKELLNQLLTYNDDANRRFVEMLREVKPSSERIGSIFSHILNAHCRWNARIDGVSPASGLWDAHPAESWSDLNRANFERSIEIVVARPNR